MPLTQWQNFCQLTNCYSSGQKVQEEINSAEMSVDMSTVEEGEPSFEELKIKTVEEKWVNEVEMSV